MDILSSIFARNSNEMDSRIQTAYFLQRIAIPAELLTILATYRIFQDTLTDWVIMAILFTLMRCRIYFPTPKSEEKTYFILSNLLSAIVWLSYGVICAQMQDSEVLVAGLFLTGMVSGVLLFQTFVKYFYIIYSWLTLGIFGLILLYKGGSLATVGGGLLILVIFLSILSFQYYGLLNVYFKLSRANSLLLEEEQRQVQELSILKDMLDTKITNRKQIENKIVRSNDDIQKSIRISIADDELLQQEIMLIYQKADYGILLSEENSNSLITNPFFSMLWDGNQVESYSKDTIQQLITHNISANNPLFISLFPFTKKLNYSNLTFKLIKNDGRIIETQLTIFKRQDSVHNLWIFKDRTDNLKNHNSISRLGQYDSLTFLPSRRLIYSKLNELVEAYQDKDLYFAVAFLDINDFKIINDSLGHSMGNEILKVFAQRLQHNMRPQDFVGRLGGDEFLCIFNGLTYKSDIEPIIANLKAAIEEKVLIDGSSLIINSSIGVSFFPCDTSSIDELISYADIAMYRAKKNKHSLYERFLPEYTAQINELHVIGQDLKSALINNALYLAYQPIYHSHTQEIAKVEILLRWRENISPNVFIPLAERLGLIQDLGLWVLEEACRTRNELAKCATLATDDIKFCINISSKQLQWTKQIDELLAVVERYNCKPKWLEFELTESTLIDYEKALSFINRLKTIGISVAIDDFGTGFSSLSCLKNLHFDVIKIDKQFLTNIFNEKREMNIFQAIIHLTQRLDAKITVEGVETQEQYDFCVRANCDYIQGFYLSRPVDFYTLVNELLVENKTIDEIIT